MSPLLLLLWVIDPMTWQMAWSPIWFAWDLCNNILLAWGIRHWIKGGVTDTSGQVIAEIKKPNVAAEVRTAWGIPTLAEIVAAVKAILPTVPDMPRVPSADEIATAMQSKQTGIQGAITKQDKALVASLQTQYAQTPQGQKDAMALAHMLHKAAGGMLTPGQCTFAASLGPVIGREFLGGIIGNKRAETVFASLEQMAIAQNQRPGGYG